VRQIATIDKLKICVVTSKPWAYDHLPCSPNAQAIFLAPIKIVLGNGESCLRINNQSVEMIALLLNFVHMRIQRKITIAQGMLCS
jgi:hypothetical protein